MLKSVETPSTAVTKQVCETPGHERAPVAEENWQETEATELKHSKAFEQEPTFFEEETSCLSEGKSIATVKKPELPDAGAGVGVGTGQASKSRSLESEEAFDWHMEEKFACGGVREKLFDHTTPITEEFSILKSLRPTLGEYQELFKAKKFQYKLQEDWQNALPAGQPTSKTLERKSPKVKAAHSLAKACLKVRSPEEPFATVTHFSKVVELGKDAETPTCTGIAEVKEEEAL